MNNYYNSNQESDKLRNEFFERMRFYLKQGAVLVNKERFFGIGNLTDKKGFQRVKIDYNCLKKGLKFLDEYLEGDEIGQIEDVVIFVKTDFPMQIGKEEVGFIIAPKIDR